VSKRIWRFGAGPAEGHADMTLLLGGKGANLAQMANLDIPVPPGFTITTEVCHAFQQSTAKMSFIDDLMKEVETHVDWLAQVFGYYPLLSVRSGAPVSMPGMMDTILNVGLTIGNLYDWKQRIGERAALDSYRRLIQMLGSTAFDIPAGVFEFQLAKVKKEAGVKDDTQLDAGHLKVVIERFRAAFKEAKQIEFPDTRGEQLRAAVAAVFLSWNSPRAIEYRKLNKIDNSLGTAVNVQAMVFGNTGENSGTGVLFSRDPATGAKQAMGEFLQNAQGEDVVAGIRTPRPLHEMGTMGGAEWDAAYDQLMAITAKLEQHFRDMQDLEFTVQDGKLWILQCRTGKRSALAAFRIARQLVDEGLIDRKTALSRLTAAQFKLVRRPRVKAGFEKKPDLVGKPASPGIAVGVPVFSAADAVVCKEPCLLVTLETTPDDIAGMAAAQGVLTQTGGATSHAAVVARAMDKPCVVGCTDMSLDPKHGVIDVLPTGGAFGAGVKITIDGETGRVWLGIDVPVENGAEDPDVQQICLWAVEATGRPVQVGTDETLPNGPLMVMAADFWGDEARLAKVLQRLAGLADRSNAALDLTPPFRFARPEDEVLRHAFGNDQEGYETQHFVAKALQMLYAFKGLDGLLVVLPNVTPEAAALLKQAGYRVATVPKNLGELLDADAVTLTQTFIDQVVGGEQIMAKLQEVLKAAGKPVRLLTSPVPAEYAVFTHLG
jgi:pyruvate,orthophosphate dikinase